MELTTLEKMKAAKAIAVEAAIDAVLHDGNIRAAMGKVFSDGVKHAMDELRAESQGFKDGSL